MANKNKLGAGRREARRSRRDSNATRQIHLLRVKRPRIDGARPPPSSQTIGDRPPRPPTGGAETVSSDQPDPFAAIRMRLAAIRKPKRGSALADLAAYERDLLVVIAIWDDFSARGEILHDGLTAFLFINEGKRLIAIDKGVDFRNWLSRYALLPGDALSNKTREAIGGRAMEHGKRVTMRAVAHFDESTRKLYLNLGRGVVCRISAQLIEQVDNGTDGVLFQTAGQQPFDIDFGNLPECEYGLRVTKESLLCRTLDANWLTDRDDQHQLYICRFFALLFTGMFGANVIVICTGEHRSGKSTAAMKPGWLLIGRDFHATLVNRDIKDIETAITNDFLVVFDNADSNKSVSAIEDLVAVAATGGSIKRRTLYTNNEMVSRPIVSHIYFTSRGMPFDRNDVVDRLLTFTFGKFDQPGGPRAGGENAAKQSVLGHRNELMSEVIVRLQLILGALEPRRNVEYPSGFRMKDFVHFCSAPADAEGWLPQMMRIFATITEEQKQLSLHGNPLYLLLRLAIGQDPEALRQPFTAAELGRRLVRIAAIAHLSFLEKGDPKALTRSLTTGQTDFKNAIGMEIGFQRRAKVNLYTFNPSSEVRAECTAEAKRLAATSAERG